MKILTEIERVRSKKKKVQSKLAIFHVPIPTARSVHQGSLELNQTTNLK